MDLELEREWRRLAGDARTALVQTENNLAYFALVVRRYKRMNLWAKIIVAAASCVPFMAKLASTSNEVSSWYVAVVPLISISLPLWGPDKIVEAASKAFGRYSAIHTDLVAFWREARVKPTQNTAEALSKLREELNRIDRLKHSAQDGITDVPDIASLKARAAIRKVADYPFDDDDAPFVDRADRWRQDPVAIPLDPSHRGGSI